LPDAQGCFVALDPLGRPFGLLQRLPDGTASHCNASLDDVKTAPSLQEAYTRLRSEAGASGTGLLQDAKGTSTLGCPECGGRSFSSVSPPDHTPHERKIFVLAINAGLKPVAGIGADAAAAERAWCVRCGSLIQFFTDVRLGRKKRRNIAPDGVRVGIENSAQIGHVTAFVLLPGQTEPRMIERAPIIDREIVLPINRVFLSYVREDAEVVHRLADRLLQDGLLTWIDVKDLVIGDDWEARIEDAIGDADYVLVFLSPRSCPKESFFQKEIRHAMNRLEQMPEGERFILPVMIEQCELPRSFRKRKIHYQRMWEPDAYEKLLRAVR
jgi:hypothetical protein